MKQMDKYINASATIKELERYRMPKSVGETDSELIYRKAYNTMLDIAKMVVSAQPEIGIGTWVKINKEIDKND